MLKIVECGCYISEKARKEFLQYCLENFNELNIDEKLECTKYLFDDYFVLIYDEEHDKLFSYGHGYMNEISDEEIKEWIEDDLDDWEIIFRYENDEW